MTTPAPSTRSPEIRFLTGREMERAFSLIRVLRPHLGEEEYLGQLLQQREAHGYAMIGALAPALVGLLGCRRVTTLARGAHLHIDDLVVDPAWRKRHVGTALLAFAHTHARRSGLGGAFLDAVPAAIPFYEKIGYGRHVVTLMRLPLAPTGTLPGGPP